MIWIHCLQYCLCCYETSVLAFTGTVLGQNAPLFITTIVVLFESLLSHFIENRSGGAMVYWVDNQDLEIKIMISTFGLKYYFNVKSLGSGYLPLIPWHLLIFFNMVLLISLKIAGEPSYLLNKKFTSEGYSVFKCLCNVTIQQTITIQR